MVKCVLSIDGGGIRGIISAKILCEVEKRLKRPLSESVCLFVGSSVGAIIAAALAVKNSRGETIYKAADILELLLKFGPKIFPYSLPRRLLSIVFSPKFSSTNLSKVLTEFFADTKMGDIPSNIMVPSYGLYTQRTHMMRNWEEKYQELKLTDVLIAASAAPTIFPPKKLVIRGTEHLMIDSALVANNPVVCGCAASEFLYPKEEVCFLSIGAGYSDKVISRVGDGLIFWAAHIAPIFFDAGMEAVDYQMLRMVGQERYIRITGPLRSAKHDITDVSSANIKALQDDADRIISECSENIDRFVGLVNS